MMGVASKAISKTPSTASLRALDRSNFFLADVRDGLGPYLAIYLLTILHWNAQNIGIAMSVMGIATVVAQTPAGALVDLTRYKRTFSIIASLFIAAASIMTISVPTYSVILGGQMVMGLAAAWFAPAIAALTLGLVGPAALDSRIGRNESFNHAGNVFAAFLAGLLGYFLSPKAIFLLLAGMSILSSLSIWSIREEDIDHSLARGGMAAEEGDQKQASLGAILKNRSVLWFALACVLFHFANAAMLPLLGQQLAKGTTAGASSAYMSACIIVAQLVMIPVSYLTGQLAPKGRKWLLLVCFAVLPIRGVLYTVTADPIALVSIQILDGVGAGIFGVLSILIVSDLTAGTGLFNTTQGAIATAVGLGASLSNAFAGAILQRSTYSTTYLVLSSIALMAVVVVWFGVPETRNMATLSHDSESEGRY